MLDMKAVQDGTLDSSSTLDPLPPVLRHGLKAVSILGFLSFISSSTLFFYLTHKLIRWRVRGQTGKGYNQFLILIYNLFLADIQQSLAFLLTVRWLAEGKIDVQTSTCWAEGWFVSTGDLASGTWIFAIALHTFLAVVKGKKLPYPVFLAVIAGLWLFIYALAIAGVVSHKKNFYVRAGAWCWISRDYAFERLWLHYFWIFVAMFGTIALYTIIYTTLHLRMRPKSTSTTSSLAPFPSDLSALDPSTLNPSALDPSALDPSASDPSASDPQVINRAARYMIIYPTIYVLCTLPLAAGRMASMNGRTIPYWYYCLAGAAITSCGWLDVVLYAFTRRALVFSDIPPAIHECGLETFGIFRTSEGLWSIRTTVEGGVLVDPTVSTRRRDHYKKNLTNDDERSWYVPTSRDGVLDDTFELAQPGVISTKTTFTVTTKPRTANLQESADDMSNPSRWPSSKHDHTPSVHSVVNSTMGNEHGNDC